MSEPEIIAQYDVAVLAELRLFCTLMLGSADAGDCMIQQIHRRALDRHDEEKNWPSERDRLFSIAFDLCGVSGKAHARYDSISGDDFGDESGKL